MPEPTTSYGYRQPGETPTGQRKLLHLLAVVMLVTSFMVIRFPGGAKGFLYVVFREVVKLNMMVKTSGWNSVESEYFLVRYKPGPGNEKNAKLVLNTAESFLEPIAQRYDYKIKGKIPVILYSSREELNASFGWPASERAMGVYWGGAIRVLSPDEWIDYDKFEEKKTIFESCGPMAHEITHLVIDYRTKGNYPRWLTEGLAQYEEYMLTGFRFTDPAGSLDQDLYPLSKMDKEFDSLPNQSLAYRQSLSAVDYIMKVYGKEKMHMIINDLSQGRSVNRSFSNSLGVDMIKFEQEWQHWLSL